MEAREIIIANTKTQRRYKIESTATTLGELKAELTQKQIDYSNMSFTEGLSKTVLLDDSTPLPTNVQFKGQTTNNLVILLTNTQKKIPSGMDRAEAFSLIKEYNLQDAIKEEFDGRNFTQVSTADLEAFINDALAEDDPEDDDQEQGTNDEKEEYRQAVVESISNTIFYMTKAGIINSPEIEDLIHRLEALADEIRKPNPVSMTIGGVSVNGDDVDNMINQLI